MLGTRLRSLRIGKRLKQEELGKLIGVGKTTISQYESETRTPDAETLSKLATIFNVSVDYLLNRTNVPSSKHVAPEWATAKDKRDFKRMLEDGEEIMFDGVPMDDEARQRVMDVLTGLFWEAKHMNKRKKSFNKSDITSQDQN